MTVAEVCIDGQHPAEPALCHVRVWSLPGGSPHEAERRARAIIRDLLRDVGASRDHVLETEHIVAELAVNAVQHAVPPYELRIVFVGTQWPAWCEVADSGSDLERIQGLLNGTAAVSDAGTPELAECGRGLLMVTGLCEGRCAAYPTTVCQTNSPGKAVGFCLPGAATRGGEDT